MSECVGIFIRVKRGKRFVAAVVGGGGAKMEMEWYLIEWQSKKTGRSESLESCTYCIACHFGIRGKKISFNTQNQTHTGTLLKCATNFPITREFVTRSMGKV